MADRPSQGGLISHHPGCPTPGRLVDTLSVVFWLATALEGPQRVQWRIETKSSRAIPASQQKEAGQPLGVQMSLIATAGEGTSPFCKAGKASPTLSGILGRGDSSEPQAHTADPREAVASLGIPPTQATKE